MFEFVIYTILLVVPVILLVRFLAGGDGVALADLFAFPQTPPWPRGVQEEEPFRWHLDRLSPSTRSRGAPAEPHASRPAVGIGLDTRKCT